MLALQLIQCVPHQDVVFNPVHTATYRVPGKMWHDAHGALISSGDTEVTVGTVPWKVRTDRIRLPAWFTRAGQGVGTKHSCHTHSHNPAYAREHWSGMGALTAAGGLKICFHT